MAVLGYDWLAQHNPRIDWIETKVIFEQNIDPPIMLGTNRMKNTVPIITEPKPDIRLISVKEMRRLDRQKGVTAFSVKFNDRKDKLPTEAPEPLVTIPAEYQEFSDVFSGEKADTLPQHQPYNLKISLEEGAQPSYGPVYSLSPTELVALREFIEENVRNGFI